MRRRRAGDHPGISRAVRAAWTCCAMSAASRETAAMRLYIKEAAKRHGLEVKAFRKTAEGLVNRRPPFIVFWESNHFLVVEGFDRGRVYLNDPASRASDGRLRRIPQELQRDRVLVRAGSAVREAWRPAQRPGGPGRPAVAVPDRAGLRGPRRAGAGRSPTSPPPRSSGSSSTASWSRATLTWLRPLLFAVAATALMRLAAAGLQQVYLTRLEVRLTLAESLGFLRHALQLPVGLLPAAVHRRYRGAGLADGAGGRADLGRAGDDGRQPADAGRLRGRDAPLRHLA